VSVNVGYFRNWWGNWYVVDNRAVSLSDFTPFSIVAPSDPRLPGGGGNVISGLYNLIPTKVGAVDELAQASSNFGKQTENWQGVDTGISARLRSGLTVQGGASAGRRLVDNCAIRSQMPELGAGPAGSNNSITANISGGSGSSPTNPYCRVVEPYLLSVRGLATYTIPRVGLQVSGTWYSNPGPLLRADYTVTSAIANASNDPQPLNRNLSSGNVTVNLVTPGTLYGARQNNIDLRIAKVLRYGRTRAQIGVDVYNLANTDVVTGYNNAFTSTSWLTPTDIVPARYAKISAQFDF